MLLHHRHSAKFFLFGAKLSFPLGDPIPWLRARYQTSKQAGQTLLIHSADELSIHNRRKNNMETNGTPRGGHVPGVGIGVFVTSEDHPNCVLLGVRKGSAGAGTYALPGGHLEFGETWEECGARETKEETGLTLKNVRCVNVLDQDGKKEVCVQGEVDTTYQKEPQTIEPHKSEGWSWHDWNNFPPTEKLFSPLKNVREHNFNPFEHNVD